MLLRLLTGELLVIRVGRNSSSCDVARASACVVESMWVAPQPSRLEPWGCPRRGSTPVAAAYSRADVWLNARLDGSLGWFGVKPLEIVYSLWSLLFKTRQLQSPSMERYVHKEAHVFAKAHGRNVRKSGVSQAGGEFFFNVSWQGFGMADKPFFRKPTLLLGIAPTDWASVNSRLDILEAGFFFPRASSSRGRVAPQRVKGSSFAARAENAPLHKGRSRGVEGQYAQAYTVSQLSARMIPAQRRSFNSFRGSLAEGRLLQLNLQGGASKDAWDKQLPAVGVNPSGSVPTLRGNSFKLSANVRSGLLRHLRKKWFLAASETSRDSFQHNVGNFSTRLLSRRRLTLVRAPISNITGLVGTSRGSLAASSGALVKGGMLPYHRYVPSEGWQASSLSSQGAQASGVTFRQPVIRYKPGLLRYWRSHRFSFQRLFSLFAASRQTRLTHVVARVSRVASFSFLRSIELSLLHVAMCSKLRSPASAAETRQFLVEAHACVNGYRAYNPYMQLYQGDTLTLSITFSCKRAGYDHLGTSGFLPGLSTHLRVTLPTSVADTPVYLEVDELTSACVVLFEPQRWGSWSRGFTQHLPHITLKMYNWKYST